MISNDLKKNEPSLKADPDSSCTCCAPLAADARMWAPRWIPSRDCVNTTGSSRGCPSNEVGSPLAVRGSDRGLLPGRTHGKLEWRLKRGSAGGMRKRRKRGWGSDRCDQLCDVLTMERWTRSATPTADRYPVILSCAGALGR